MKFALLIILLIVSYKTDPPEAPDFLPFATAPLTQGLRARAARDVLRHRCEFLAPCLEDVVVQILSLAWAVGRYLDNTQIIDLANLVSLTPGSLSLDVSEDRRTLYVHVMFLDDVESCRREIKEGFERRVLELLR